MTSNFYPTINYPRSALWILKVVEGGTTVLQIVKWIGAWYGRPWDQTILVLSSIEKVKPDSLLSLMCMFPESNGTKFWSHSFHLQNSGILQTRMDQRVDPMKTNFDIFQMQKWISQTVRAQNVDEKNGVICLVSFFPSWIMALKLPKIVHF